MTGRAKPKRGHPTQIHVLFANCCRCARSLGMCLIFPSHVLACGLFFVWLNFLLLPSYASCWEGIQNAFLGTNRKLVLARTMCLIMVGIEGVPGWSLTGTLCEAAISGTLEAKQKAGWARYPGGWRTNRSPCRRRLLPLGRAERPSSRQCTSRSPFPSTNEIAGETAVGVEGVAVAVSNWMAEHLTSGHL